MSGRSDPNAATDVSAVLVKLKAPEAGFTMDMMYNRQGNRLTFAWPIASVMADLFSKIGWFDQVLALVAYLVALVATLSILASIYNSMNERRREIAILRALGARRITVFGAILLEAASISALGMLAGFACYWVIMVAVAGVIREQTGVVLDPMKYNAVMLWAPGALIVLGALAGVIPAIKAYLTHCGRNIWSQLRSRNKMLKIKAIWPILWLVLASGLLVGCGQEAPSVPPSSEAAFAQADVPPHGGTPVLLGEDYKLELVLDAPAGKLDAYVFDGEFENFVRIATESFEMSARSAGGEEVLRFQGGPQYRDRRDGG